MDALFSFLDILLKAGEKKQVEVQQKINPARIVYALFLLGPRMSTYCSRMSPRSSLRCSWAGCDCPYAPKKYYRRVNI